MSTWMWLATETRPWRAPQDAYRWASTNGGSTRLVRGELVDITIEDEPAPDSDGEDERAH